ncbi:hypothetical protein Efla_005659 [Eimeria flavescens]
MGPPNLLQRAMEAPDEGALTNKGEPPPSQGPVPTTGGPPRTEGGQDRGPGVAGGGLLPRASRSRALERLRAAAARKGRSEAAADSAGTSSSSSSNTSSSCSSSGSNWGLSGESDSSVSEGELHRGASREGAPKGQKRPPAILAARRLERKRQRQLEALATGAPPSRGILHRGAPSSGGRGPRGPLRAGLEQRRFSEIEESDEGFESDEFSATDEDFEEALFLGTEGPPGASTGGSRGRRKRRRRAARASTAAAAAAAPAAAAAAVAAVAAVAVAAAAAGVARALIFAAPTGPSAYRAAVKRRRSPVMGRSAAYSGQQHRRRRKRRTAATPSQLTAEVRDLLREATEHYLAGSFEAAVSLLKETIRKAPGLHDPFHLLGLVFEEAYGDKRRALDCYLVACHLVGSDARLWQRSGSLAEEVGDLPQAAYAYRRCLRNLRDTDRNKEETDQQQAERETDRRRQQNRDEAADAEERRLEEEVAFQLARGEYQRACSVLQPLQAKHWGLASVSSLYASCLFKAGRLLEAREVLEGVLHQLLPHEEMQQLLLQQQQDLLLQQQQQQQTQQQQPEAGTEQLAQQETKHHVQQEAADSSSSSSSNSSSSSGSLLARMDKEQQDCLNMLCEIDVAEGQHSHCLLLIKAFLGKASLRSAPLDLLMKLAATGVITGKLDCTAEAEARLNAAALCHRPRPSVEASSSSSSSSSGSGYEEELNPDFTDMYLLLADAFLFAQRWEDARRLLRRVLSVQQRQTDSALCVKYATCCVALDRSDEAIEVLQNCLAANEAQCSDLAGIKDAEARLLLADLLRSKGRQLDADCVLLSVSFKGLWEQDALPEALPTEERERQYHQVHEGLTRLLRAQQAAAPTAVAGAAAAGAAGAPAAAAAAGRGGEESATALATRFLSLVAECELDSRRVLREAQQRRVEVAQEMRGPLPASEGPPGGPSADSAGGQEQPLKGLLVMQKKSAANKAKQQTRIQTQNVKRDLGLKGIEDFAGLPAYCDFLTKGSELLGSLGRWGEAVALLEGVQSDWRQKKHGGEPADKKALKEQLQLLALKLSLEGGLHRLALSFLRRLLQRRLRRGPPPWGLLGVYGRLLFRKAEGSLGAVSSSKDRDFFLENRSWVVRQLLCHPQDYALCLLAGHFSMSSSRWRFAAAEYTRALFVRQDRHGAVLKSFSVLCHYIELRHRAEKKEADGILFKAETLYNLGRAYHHLCFYRLCVPLYLRCLALLDSRPSSGEGGGFANPGGGPRAWLASGQTAGAELTAQDPSLTADWRQLRMCAAFNLFSLWLGLGAHAQARRVAQAYLVWD